MEKKSLFLIFATAVVSAVSIYLNKFAIKGIDSDIFTFSKNILVSLFLLSIIFAVSGLKELKQLSRKDWMKLSLIGLIGGSIPFLLYFKGLQIAQASAASLIHKSMFIFVIALASIFLKEKLDKRIIIAAALLFLGTYLMIKPVFSVSSGELFILAATLFWAAENVISKKALSTLSGNTVAFGRMFFGSIFIFAYLLVTGKATILFSVTSLQFNWILLTSGLLLLYVMTWYNGLKHTSVSLATSILLLGAPITIALNYLSGTAIGAFQLLGSIMILLGVFAFTYFSEKRPATWKA